MGKNEPVDGTHFHTNGFARGFVLTQRQNATLKWPSESRCISCMKKNSHYGP